MSFPAMITGSTRALTARPRAMDCLSRLSRPSAFSFAANDTSSQLAEYPGLSLGLITGRWNASESHDFDASSLCNLRRGIPTPLPSQFSKTEENGLGIHSLQCVVRLPC